MGFREYFFKRLASSIITWVFVLILNFIIFYAPSPESRFQSFASQVKEYLSFVFLERFGPYPYLPIRTPTLDYIISISVYSLILLALSLTIAIALGIFLGSLASYKNGGKIDAGLTVAAFLPSAFPVWWLALVFFMYLHPPLPAFGWSSERWWFQSPWSDIFSFIPDFLSHLLLPLVSFSLALTGIYFLVTRNSLKSIHAEDYMITAKAKGLTPAKIMFKHALRNAIINEVSIIALTPSLLVLGVIMIEMVFSRNGLGFMLVGSVINPVSGELMEPTPILQAIFMVFATVVIVLHFIVDISVCILDPRIRTDGGSRILDEKSREDRLSQKFHRRVLKFLRKFMRGYWGKFGLGVIIFFAIVGFTVPYLPLARAGELEPPSLNHLLGTDEHGRDVLAMIFLGARASLLEGLGAVSLALTVGCFVGLFSGYFRDHWIGYLLDRITDLFLSVPIIVIVAYFPTSPGPHKWLLAVGLTTWTVTAKLVRMEVISAREKPFIEASRAAGARDTYILFRCLLPECIPAVASSMPFVAITALSVQSSLDYLGFQRRLWSSIDPVTLAPYTSWGTMLSYGSQIYIPLKQWWLIFPPGICIALLGFALIAIGNKMIEVTNPKLAT